MFSSELRMVSIFEHIIQSHHMCSVSVLYTCHIPLQYRCYVRKSDHIRPTYINNDKVIETDQKFGYRYIKKNYSPDNERLIESYKYVCLHSTQTDIP